MSEEYLQPGIRAGIPKRVKPRPLPFIKENYKIEDKCLVERIREVKYFLK